MSDIVFLGGVEGFLFILAAFVVILVFSFLPLQKLGLAELRRMERIDRIDEMVKACAEMGRPVLFNFASISLTGQPHYVAAGNEICRRVAKTCGDLGIEMYTTCMQPETFVMMLDQTRAGFMQSAHPEKFRQENNYYSGYGMQESYYTLSTIADKNVGAYVQVGFLVMGTDVPLWEVLHRIGGTSFISTSPTDVQPLAFAFADCALLGEEQAIVSAYLRKDPVEVSSIIGGDFVKLILIGLLAVFVIRRILGM